MANTTEKKAPRITKANRFEDIKVLLTGEGEIAYGTTVEIAVEFINNELSLLSRKNTKKEGAEPTEAQKQREANKGLILEFLATKPDGATCSDMIQEIPEFKEAGLNTSAVSSMTSALVTEGRIVRLSPKKGRTPFKLA